MYVSTLMHLSQVLWLSLGITLEVYLRVHTHVYPTVTIGIVSNLAFMLSLNILYKIQRRNCEIVLRSVKRKCYQSQFRQL